jgi:hypothetical protein
MLRNMQLSGRGLVSAVSASSGTLVLIAELVQLMSRHVRLIVSALAQPENSTFAIGWIVHLRRTAIRVSCPTSRLLPDTSVK